MLFLTASGTQQGDPVALLMVLALAAVVAVMAVRKALRRARPVQAPAVPEAPAAAPAPQAPGSAGRLKLHDVEPKTAAMLMAITADKLGKPLNELRFLSIKEVKD